MLLKTDKKISPPLTKLFGPKKKKRSSVSSLPAIQEKSFEEKLAKMLCKGTGKTTVKEVATEFESKGILEDDPRVSELVKILKEEVIISEENLTRLISQNREMMEKIYTDDFCVKKFYNFVEKIKNIYNEIKSSQSGKVASYIPQLKKMNKNYFGVSICTVDGQRFSIGDCNIDFCIQSCCKIINYCVAYEQHGSSTHKYVGKEPSGVSFNALTLDSSGKPHNPCINAGAIMTCSLINNKNLPIMDEAHLRKLEDITDTEFEANRFEYLRDIYSRLCNAKIGFNNSVYLSERATGHRNYALGHFMMEQNPGFPPETKLKDVLEFYFQCCSLEVTANKLSILAATLASGGTNPLTCDTLFSKNTVRNCLSLMNSCGMYDYSGEFSFDIGIPSKSGVGGGIISVIPGLMGVATFSPPLDNQGNSVRGVEFLKRLGEEFHFHHFDNFTTQKFEAKMTTCAKNEDTSTNSADRAVSEAATTVLLEEEHNAISLYKTILFASVGDLGGIKRMYLKGFSLSDGDYDKRTPLHLAASNGHLHIVKYLASVLTLEQMNPLDRWNNPPIEDAKREGHKEIVKFLESYTPFKNSNNNSDSNSNNSKNSNSEKKMDD